ncbi:MAG: DUF1460 domain-containing protein [Bacteroidales bacterium]|nr:DUF1460 domain-containing protein [Bacteroidales bacterium]
MRGFLSVLLLFSLSCGNAEESENIVYYTAQDSVKCVEVLTHAFDSNPITSTDVAKLFLGKPYQGETLDREQKEGVVVRFDSLDCTTFVETITALTRCINKKANNFNSFVNELELIRYRDGECNGYDSRLHYFSEWIYNNQTKGIIEEILPNNLITTEQRSINFMSLNADKYAGITNDSILKKIKVTEAFLSAQPFFYIPKDKVALLTTETIREGDIIAIVTDIKGLDISHVGFASFVNGKIHLLHASSGKKEVVIDPLPLNEYLAKFKHHIGIKILRIKNYSMFIRFSCLNISYIDPAQ